MDNFEVIDKTSGIHCSKHPYNKTHWSNVPKKVEKCPVRVISSIDCDKIKKILINTTKCRCSEIYPFHQNKVQKKNTKMQQIRFPSFQIQDKICRKATKSKSQYWLHHRRTIFSFEKTSIESSIKVHPAHMDFSNFWYCRAFLQQSEIGSNWP